MLRKLLSKWPTNLSSSLPSTGWILLVNNILWHLPPLGEICPQLLYRTSGEQLAHGAGTQWLLPPSGPKWHTIGRQRRNYQRMYLGILGKRKRCQSGKQELRQKRRMDVSGEACGKKTKLQEWAGLYLRADQLQAFIPNRHLPSRLLSHSCWRGKKSVMPELLSSMLQ